MTFTKSQLSAIDEGKKNILVSAAAGSGKSTVLCERIRKRIVQDGGDIMRLLVMSFNNESANDLKSKLEKIFIREYESSGNPRMLRQSLLVEKAMISTIHSFNLSVIRDNFELLGLPADVAIADENDISELKNTIMSDVISYMYSHDSDFADLTDVLITDRDDSLESIFLKIYDSVINEPKGVDAIHTNAMELSSSAESFDNTKWGKALRLNLNRMFECYSLCFEKAAENFDPSSGERSYYVRYTGYSELLRNLIDAPDFSRMFELLQNRDSLDFRVSSNGEKDIAFYSEKLKKLKKTLDDIGRLSLCINRAGEDMTSTAVYLECLFRVLNEFEKRFSGEKKKRGEIDFSDMERLSHKLLVNEDSSASEIAKEYRKRFDEVYVDEYQDTNTLQDEIIRAISEDNLFIVGDIKQSIYGFRGALPDIFSRYRRYGFGSDNEKTIFLSENFRSDKLILKFSNSVFSKIMRCVDSIGYVDEDDLKFAKSGESFENVVDIRLFSKKDMLDTALENTEDESSFIADEYTYVASKIRELLDSGVPACDIAVISRKFDAEGFSQLKRAFEDYSIEIDTQKSECFFDRQDVLLVLCLLNSIDNPRRDVYFAGLLRSEIFKLTSEDLVNVRIECPADCLYSSLKQYCIKYPEREISKKGEKFFSFSARMRLVGNSYPLDEFVRCMIEESDLVNSEAFGKSEKAVRTIRSDICRIYSLAKSFSSRNSEGLSGFVRYLDYLRKKNISATLPFESKNAVRVMTIHASKGLQFKYCFLINAGKVFKMRDTLENRKTMPLSFDRTLGIALRLPDCAERIECKHESAMLKSIVSKQNNETVEEEMRLFYVALTRAVNKLTITGSYNIGSIISKINSSLSMPELPVFPFEVYSSRSFLQWILYCLKDIPKDCYSLEVNPSLRCLPLKAAYRTNNNTETCTVSISDEELSDLSLLDMDYPYKYSAKIPAKLSVSKLTPNILDSADDCTAVLEIPYIRQKTPLPSFMTDEKTQNGSAAGTATHEFMQFCDFGRIEKNGIDKEIEYLVSKRFLSKEKAGLISRKALSGFFASKLYEDMKNADEIFREMRFNIKLPAGLFTENAERYKNISDDEVLVQGVMDCIFRDKNGDYTLIDYKTDSIGSGMSTAEFENELKKRYSSQLGYYSIAAEQLFGKSPKKIMLYSFALADTITLFYNESAD